MMISPQQWPCRTPQSRQQPSALIQPVPQPRRCQPSYWLTLSDNPLLSNGTGISAAATGLHQAGTRGDMEQEEGIISRCLASQPAQCCGSGDMPFLHSPRDKMCFCTEPCVLDLLQALQCHTPRDAPVPVAASGARGVTGASGAALAPQTWLSPCSRLCSWLRGNFPGLLSLKDSAQWEKGPAEGLRRGKCL